MTAVPLFDVPDVGRARKSDPATSKDAARRQAGSCAIDRVYEAFVVYGPLTDRELCNWVAPLDPERWPTYKTARSRLKSQGILQATGEVRDGMQVWALLSRPTRVVETDLV